MEALARHWNLEGNRFVKRNSARGSRHFPYKYDISGVRLFGRALDYFGKLRCCEVGEHSTCRVLFQHSLCPFRDTKFFENSSPMNSQKRSSSRSTIVNAFVQNALDLGRSSLSTRSSREISRNFVSLSMERFEWQIASTFGYLKKHITVHRDAIRSSMLKGFQNSAVQRILCTSR